MWQEPERELARTDVRDLARPHPIPWPREGDNYLGKNHLAKLSLYGSKEAVQWPQRPVRKNLYVVLMTGEYFQ